MKVVILAAGMGSRLGDHDLPKPLTKLSNGHTILGLLLDTLKHKFQAKDIIVIVGYHKEMIMDLFPSISYVHNPNFAKENTAKSLTRALESIDDDVLWINGDVIVHPSVIDKILNANTTSMVVNSCPVGEEEVKYACDEEGKILEISKVVADANGEALGVNLIMRDNLKLFIQNLKRCDLKDYFEKGLEYCIQDGMHIMCVPIEADLCAEIDFPEDLEKANTLLKKWDLQYKHF